jgi:hypothetical protein
MTLPPMRLITAQHNLNSKVGGTALVCAPAHDIGMSRELRLGRL